MRYCKKVIDTETSKVKFRRERQIIEFPAQTFLAGGLLPGNPKGGKHTDSDGKEILKYRWFLQAENSGV